MKILGEDNCTNHICSKSAKCKWYLGNSCVAYEAKRVFVNNENKCMIYERVEDVTPKRNKR
jgi:hypothetical protein